MASRSEPRLLSLLDRFDDLGIAFGVVADSAGDVDPVISDVVFDSRRVGPGALFCCVRGQSFDGHRFADAAVGAGAVALLVEERLPDVDVPQVHVDSVRPAMAHAAAAFFGQPSEHLDVVGITGTNGKTTIAALLQAVFRAQGWPATVIGTLGGIRTTPEAPELQRLLADGVSSGDRVAVMEVSSHALAQARVDGIRFRVAVFTNLTEDHLDYHHSMDEYFRAKAQLFTPGRCDLALLNRDDPYGRRLLDTVDVPARSFGSSDATTLASTVTGTRFEWRDEVIDLPLAGGFNVLNAVGAAETAVELGLGPTQVAAGLAESAPIPGRFEVVSEQPFTVIVDYAHTPDGLKQVLVAARDLCAGRLTVVFGCGGDRDREKRPLMGAEAETWADVVVVTSDNPRSESPGGIIEEILAGMIEPTYATVIEERAEAIGFAIARAEAGDVVVVAGKGHETTQTVGDRVLDFDDRAVSRAARRRKSVIRLLIAAGLAMTISLVGTRFLIRWLTSHRIGQPIQDDGPEGHRTKAGTPTMGGAAIVAGAAIGYIVSDLYNGIYTRTGIFVMMAIVGSGAVGLIDDWIKVSRERNLGLNKRAKIVGLLTVAIGFAVLMVTFTDVHTELSFTRHDNFTLDLGPVGWVVWAVLLILATSNAVNLTDGLDGLAGGSSILAFTSFVVIGFWAFRHLDVYDLPHALDVAVVAAAMLGACTGFLWWNAAPAQIFMGDTGSLALGTGLACLALATNTDLLLPIIGGLFVLETVSVIIQVVSFQVFGQRVFRMAPIHHHFELMGWHETWVIIRFWIFAGFCTALALGLYYADFISTGAAD